MADSDLDPQAFLKTVRDLSDKRQREDNERYEKLEAQILQDRTARLERRAERERSLSPEKTPTSVRSFDVRTPIKASSPAGSRHTSPTRDPSRQDSILSPRSDLSASTSLLERPASPTKPASPSAAMPSRANTMSWQRRPQSGVRNRPLSVLAAENNASRASPEPSPSLDSRPSSRDEPSKEDIAKTLSSKDPSWFRHTPERGIGLAANRRSTQEESVTVTGSEKRHLPGLMRPPSSTGLASPSSLSPGREPLATLGETETLASPTSATNRASTPEVEKAAFGRSIPSLQSRPSVARPTSPIRGMGGFVESAMMKRTDSVSKRWSNTQPTGLMRADSTASIRSGLDSSRSSMLLSPSQYQHGEPRNGTESPPRPDSGHSEISNLTLQDHPRITSPPASLHGRSRSHASLRGQSRSTNDLTSAFSPPLSPNKKFTPQKSSWLESALARPESPTKQPSLARGQPAWMVELSKNKHQRDGPAIASPQEDAFTKVSSEPAAALLSRTPVAQTKSDRDSGLPASPTRSTLPTVRETRDFTPPTKPKSPALQKLRSETLSSHSEEDKPDPPKALDAAFESPRPKEEKINDTPTKKIKPETPPKKISVMPQPKVQSTNSSATSGPEFLNALGKLKRTTTQNYKAPDVLKDNILRGKAGLNLTDGPQKSQRVDEFKDSILKKKAEMKEKAPEPGSKRSAPAPLIETPPEALLVKKGLQRSNASQDSSARRDITPEALARHKTLRGKPQPRPTKLSDEPMIAPFSSITVSTQNLPVASISGSKAPERSETKSAPPSAISQATVPQAKPSTFADRFNPGLAGLLARGPPTLSPVSPSASASPLKASGDQVISPARSTNNTADSKGKELTHMTKDRARGPKRRKPKTSTAAETSERPQSSSSLTPVQPRPKSATVRNLSMNLSSQANSAESGSSPARASTFPISAPSSRSPMQSPAQSRVSSQNNQAVAVNVAGENGTANSGATDDDKENSSSGPSVKNAAAMWAKKDSPASSPARGMPIQLPSKKDEEAAMRSAGLLASSSIRAQASKPDGPPKPAKSSRVVSQTLPDAASVQVDESVAYKKRGARPSRTERVLEDYFGAIPALTGQLQLDPQSVLSTDQTRRNEMIDKLSPRLFRFDAPLRRPTSFFNLFNKRDPARPVSAASQRSTTSPPTDDTPTISITELHPYSQEDLDPEHIYMLDCLASILVIPGPLLSASSHWDLRFTQACLFAQDYALLAAGMQDRPSLPAALVSLGDIPAPAAALFPAWDARRGAWGAAGIMGARSAGDVALLGVQDVLDSCRR